MVTTTMSGTCIRRMTRKITSVVGASVGMRTAVRHGPPPSPELKRLLRAFDIGVICDRVLAADGCRYRRRNDAVSMTRSVTDTRLASKCAPPDNDTTLAMAFVQAVGRHLRPIPTSPPPRRVEAVPPDSSPVGSRRSGCCHRTSGSSISATTRALNSSQELHSGR